MRWTFDANADALYLYLSGNSSASQVELPEGVVVDMDVDGVPVGVEVLGSNRALNGPELEKLGVPADALTMLAALMTQPFPVVMPRRQDVSTHPAESLVQLTDPVLARA